jgi:RimJ/RimL family protein N-acetyltransferase
MMSTAQPHIILRPATIQDSQLLLNWRNDPTTRGASLSTEEIPFEVHSAWYSKALANNGVNIYIIETPDGEPVGTIRSANGTLGREVSVSIAREHRRKGFARKAIAILTSDPHAFVALIRKENEGSLKSFTENGFRIVGEKNDVLILEKEAK